MEKNNSTISINIPNPIAGIEKLKNYIHSFALEIYNGPIRHNTSPTKKFINSLKNPFKNLRNFKLPNMDKKFILRIALPILVVVIFILGIVNVLRSFSNTQATNDNTDAISLPKPNATREINREFQFPLRDEEGEEAGRFNYVIENAELRKQIIVKGQRATSIEGRIFIILNLKITNNLNQGVSINTRDYIRVIVNNNKSELLAPDIHNDPVEVQAISTKYTRVGLAIDESDATNPITIQVGEIGGEKQSIEISLK